MHRLAQPARDFWSTDPRHFWWLLESDNEAGKRLSVEDKEELLQLIWESKAQEAAEAEMATRGAER